MAIAVVRQMCACIRKAEAFVFIVDGTIDIVVHEQESIVVRYVNEDLVPHEVLGFFAKTNATTGEALSVMLFDCFLRGQTYDEASSRSGMYIGTQALIAEQQPLAVLMHCLMHAGNLVAQQAIESSIIIQDAASLTNDVAATCNRSSKLTNILHSIQALKHDRASLRPLCPTRVLVRGAARKQFWISMKAQFRRYQSMLRQAVEKLRLKPEAYSNRAQVVNLSWVHDGSSGDQIARKPQQGCSVSKRRHFR